MGCIWAGDQLVARVSCWTAIKVSQGALVIIIQCEINNFFALLRFAYWTVVCLFIYLFIHLFSYSRSERPSPPRKGSLPKLKYPFVGNWQATPPAEADASSLIIRWVKLQFVRFCSATCILHAICATSSPCATPSSDSGISSFNYKCVANLATRSPDNIFDSAEIIKPL